MVSEQAVPWTKYTLTTAIVRSFLRGQQKKACSVMHCSAEAIFRHHRLRLKGSRSEPTTVAAEMRDVVQKSVGGPESKANLGSAWTGVQGRSFISVSVRLVCTTTQTHLPQNHTLGELKSAVITM